MYRRVSVSSPNQTPAGHNITVLYHVHGAIPLSHYLCYDGSYNSSVSFAQAYFPVVFDDSLKFGIGVPLDARKSYEFILDVDENQPEIESIEELSSDGVIITVYNADGVIVCRSGAGISVGEMTSVPGEEPSEMTSEPIEAPGEMTSEPIEAPGALI